MLACSYMAKFELQFATTNTTISMIWPKVGCLLLTRLLYCHLQHWVYSEVFLCLIHKNSATHDYF